MGNTRKTGSKGVGGGGGHNWEGNQTILIRVRFSVFHKYLSNVFQGCCIYDTKEGTSPKSPGC